MKNIFLSIALGCVIAMTSCNSYNNVLKAEDYDYRYEAAKNMIEHTNPLTKTFLYKPIAGSVNAFGKISDKGYTWFDKALNEAKNAKPASKESLDNSQEAIPGFITAGITWISGLTVPFWIIFSIVCILIFIKPAIYYIYRLKLKMYQFFKLESDMLLVNIEDLEDKAKNATSEIEKNRLLKIVERQRAIYTNFSSIANWFYKSHQEAAMDARDDVRDCDSTDYDAIVNETTSVSETDNVTIDTYQTPDPLNNTNNQSGSRKPSVIF